MDPSKIFRENDVETLIGTIKNHPLGLIIATTQIGSPIVAHVPILVERRADEIFLLFHLAAKNEACQALLETNTGLCVFTGPNAYISPDWYDISDQVPTWNYVSVECTGDIRKLSSHELVQQLDGLSDQFEQQLLPKPVWKRSKMRDGKFEAMQRAIIGFEMKITNIQGTTKTSQNKPKDARNKVIYALQDHPIAELMKNSIK